MICLVSVAALSDEAQSLIESHPKGMVLQHRRFEQTLGFFSFPNTFCSRCLDSCQTGASKASLGKCDAATASNNGMAGGGKNWRSYRKAHQGDKGMQQRMIASKAARSPRKATESFQSAYRKECKGSGDNCLSLSSRTRY